MNKIIKYNCLINTILIIILVQISNYLHALTDDFFKEDVNKNKETVSWEWGLVNNMFFYLDKDADIENKILNTTKLNFSFYISSKTFFKFQAINQLEYDFKNVTNTPDIDKLFFENEGTYHNITIGRNDFSISKGIIFANISDGINVEYKINSFELQLIANYTGLISKNYDIFKRNLEELENGSEKLIAGGKLGYSFLDQFFYIAILKQWDLKEYKQQLSNKSDTIYYALGFKNSYKQRIFFDGEFIYQTGDTKKYNILLGAVDQYISNDLSIRAFALDFELEYHTKLKSNLKFKMQYSLASGDANGIIGRSENDNTLNSFRGFSSYYTGYSFSPIFRNIHVFRIETSFFPFTFKNKITNILINIQYSNYFKQVKEGIISYEEAENNKSYLGNALDLFIFYRVYLGFNIISQTGFFIKGNAFLSESPYIFKQLIGFQLWL